MSVIDKIVGGANKAFTFVEPHLPTIGIVGGTILVGIGGFMTGKATLQVHKITEDHKSMVNETRREVNGYSEERYTESERKRDVFQCYCVTAGKLARLYAPGLTIAAAGFACMFAGLGTLKRWHALAVSSVAALDERFSQYRGNVINELGTEADKRFMLGEKAQSVEEKTVEVNKTVVDDEGNEQVETQTVTGINDIIEDDFTRVFNSRNRRWESNFLMIDNFIKTTENYYTKSLQAHRLDHVFLNTLLKEFGFPETGIGHFYGWTDRPGCAVRIDVTPYIEEFGTDDDGQFPLYVPFATYYDEDRDTWEFVNREDEDLFRQRFIEDENKVGFILKFLVDTDENGVPCEIYNQVYNKKAA